eukprot:185654-Pleurochrysis_carterae.AAC.1
MEVDTPAPAAVQPYASAEVATETPALLAVQPDASAVSMEKASHGPRRIPGGFHVVQGALREEAAAC